MKKAYIFAELVVGLPKAESTSGIDFFEPTGGLLPTHELSGFCFLQLWLTRSLDQVNALVGGAKVLFRGVFFFFFSFCNYGYRLFAFPFLLAILFMVQVKSLHKSRQPSEHGLNLLNQVGKIIQLEIDGEYSLIEFQNLRILSKDKKTRIPLQWYVHKSDYAKASN